jgi:predicted Zn-dependent peptidase
VDVRHVRLLPLAVFAALALGAGGARAYNPGEGRKTTDKDFAVRLQRFELPNGLVVLLAPDPGSTSVLVWTTFRAGTLYEPAGRSGMAHLVEHLLATGPTPQTDYATLLESRRARNFNASTGAELMSFQAVVPAEELPVALWVAADRMGTLPSRIDDALVERHRQVVIQERAIRHIDAPYGLVHERLYEKLFAAPHPLHGTVAGVPEELASATAEEVRSFAQRLIVPANGILTIAGRFDPDQARRLVEDTLGRLPPGERAPEPVFPPLREGFRGTAEEVVARDPGVEMGWRLGPLADDGKQPLRIGAQLFSLLADGAFGMRVGASVEEDGTDTVFLFLLTVPDDEPVSSVDSDAQGLLRQLTTSLMPFDFLVTANLALDRIALFQMDTLEGRAAVLTRLEVLFGSRRTVSQDLGAHWGVDPFLVRELAGGLLSGPHVTIHARPTRPRPAQAENRR